MEGERFWVFGHSKPMSSRVEPLRPRLDDRSFERLYRQHLPEVYRYVLRDVGNLSLIHI